MVGGHEESRADRGAKGCHARRTERIATDGLILALDLFVLEDDRHYFPPYEAVAVIRQQTVREHPEIMQSIADLGAKISDQEMQQLNYALDGQHRDVKDVAHEFLRSKGLVH